MTAETLAGRLVLRPGREGAVRCERPMVSAALLDRLTAGRHAALLPEIIGAVFTLCADAQRGTSRRAIRAALGLSDAAADVAREARMLTLHVAREHLQRFALDLPTLVPCSAAASVQWMRDAPVVSLPPVGAASGEGFLAANEAALGSWLERRLFGLAPQAWLDGWVAERGAWLDRWCRERDHPLARWLAAVRDDALAIAWPCRPLDVLRDGEAGMRALAAAVAADPALPERPVWQGAPAETGPWTRVGQEWPAPTVWDRLGARLAEVARIGTGATLATGALPVGDGEGIAWTEMSRGLLLHWVRLEPGERDAKKARAARYQVFAPTEWNFHPEGAFAQMLRRASLSPVQVSLATAALDPCVAFTIEQEAQRA